MPPAAAAIGGAAVSGAIGKSASSKQASATRYAADHADPFRSQRGFYQNILQGVYGGASSPQTPASTVGGLFGGMGDGKVGGLITSALSAMRPSMGRSASSSGSVENFIRSNPAYQFNFEETMRAGKRGASTSGLFESGNLYADLMQRGSGLAAQTYDAEMNRIMTMAGATVGSPAAAGALSARAAGIEAGGTMNAAGQLGYGLTRAAQMFNQPTTSTSMITDQTGYTGGAEGVISGDEWASW